jgi:hypothetical protein
MLHQLMGIVSVLLPFRVWLALFATFLVLAGGLVLWAAH